MPQASRSRATRRGGTLPASLPRRPTHRLAEEAADELRIRLRPDEDAPLHLVVTELHVHVRNRWTEPPNPYAVGRHPKSLDHARSDVGMAHIVDAYAPLPEPATNLDVGQRDVDAHGHERAVDVHRDRRQGGDQDPQERLTKPPRAPPPRSRRVAITTRRRGPRPTPPTPEAPSRDAPFVRARSPDCCRAHEPGLDRTRSA